MIDLSAMKYRLFANEPVMKSQISIVAEPVTDENEGFSQCPKPESETKVWSGKQMIHMKVC